MVAVVIAMSMALAASDAPPEVTVRESNGIYTVLAEFIVEERAEAALAVLKDYKRIPRFMPDVRTSVVRQRAGERVVVERDLPTPRGHGRSQKPRTDSGARAADHA